MHFWPAFAIVSDEGQRRTRFGPKTFGNTPPVVKIKVFFILIFFYIHYTFLPVHF